jgi:hypothetical protein
MSVSLVLAQQWMDAKGLVYYRHGRAHLLELDFLLVDGVESLCGRRVIFRPPWRA